MKNKELHQQIYRDAESIPTPEGICPAAIEEKLKQHKKQKKRRWKTAAIAACTLLAVTGTSLFAVTKFGHDSLEAKRNAKYDRLYGLIQEASESRSFSVDIVEDVIAPGNTAEGDGAMKAYEDAPATDISKSEGTFSTTNIQVEGVDEGDIMKTDGAYVYALNRSHGSINIIKIDNGMMHLTARIPPMEDAYQFQEVYLNDNQLIVLTEKSTSGYIPYDYYEDVPNYTREPVETMILTYDIRDKKNPVLQGKVRQSGSYHSSRLQGGYLYIFSKFAVNMPLEKSPRNCYVPSVNGQLLKPEDIYFPKKPNNTDYMLMTAINLKNPTKICDSKGVLSAMDTFYVSSHNIYGAARRGNKTDIVKFGYKKGKFSYQAAGNVKGYLESSFSLDEYKGNLRLVTTVERIIPLDNYWGNMYNNVYVLDKNLKKIGSVTGLAKDERIYSARFMGEQGYFVTYRETDPLFSVDFSNPHNPKIVGSLKIPGFSEYLHFYGKDRLLGIGVEDNESRTLKLSMFDISDPKNVKEIHKQYITDAYDSEALHNHRAVMIDVEKNIFGFATTGGYTGEGGYEACYRVFSYTSSGFQEQSRIPAESGYGHMYDNMRGLYSGSFFYLLESEMIRSFSLDSFKPIERLYLY